MPLSYAAAFFILTPMPPVFASFFAIFTFCYAAFAYAISLRRRQFFIAVFRRFRHAAIFRHYFSRRHFRR